MANNGCSIQRHFSLPACRLRVRGYRPCAEHWLLLAVSMTAVSGVLRWFDSPAAPPCHLFHTGLAVFLHQCDETTLVEHCIARPEMGLQPVFFALHFPLTAGTIALHWQCSYIDRWLSSSNEHRPGSMSLSSCGLIPSRRVPALRETLFAHFASVSPCASVPPPQNSPGLRPCRNHSPAYRSGIRGRCN